MNSIFLSLSVRFQETAEVQATKIWKSRKRENFCVTTRSKLLLSPRFSLLKVAHEITTHARQIHSTNILSGFSKRLVAKSKRS